MVPAQRSRTIPPGNIGLERTSCITEIKYIPAKITTQVNTVLLGETIIHLRIQVIEIITRTIEVAALFDKGLYQYIDICTPCRENKGCLIFFKRALYGEP